MATKISNYHIDIIMNSSKNYNIFDIYIALVHTATEVNGKFIINSVSKKNADLINLVKKYVKVSYRTIHNNINELIKLGILEYNSELSAWLLLDMDKMIKSVNETPAGSDSCKHKGYTKIRDIFLTSEFQKMKAIEKRCMVYLAQLCDSKASKVYSEFVMNLNKPNSNWLKVLRTKSKYYARYIISKMLNNYKDLFDNRTEEFRFKDIAPKTISGFKFAFSCRAIEKLSSDNANYELVKTLNIKEYELVKEKIRFSNVTLTKNQIMHLVRSISTIKQWFLKDRVAQIIINKYVAIQIHKSRDEIKSLPAYLIAVVKSVITEYEEFKSNNNSRGIALGISFGESTCCNHNYSYSNLKGIMQLI